MSKWYEVEVQTLVVYAVEVKDNENEQNAIQTALFDWTRDGKTTATALPVPATHLSIIKANANRVRHLDSFYDLGGDDED